MGRLRTGVGVDKIKGAEPSQFSQKERHEIKSGLTRRLDAVPQKFIQMPGPRKGHQGFPKRQKPSRFPEHCPSMSQLRQCISTAHVPSPPRK